MKNMKRTFNLLALTTICLLGAESLWAQGQRGELFREDFTVASIAAKPASSVIYEYPGAERMVQNVSIVAAADGALVAAWSNKESARHDNSPDNKVMVSRSADDGATWSAPQVVDGVFAINPTFLKARDGELWLFYNKNNSRTQDDTSIHYQRSRDHGRTWSESARLNTGYQVEVIVHNGIVLANGDMLVSFHYDRASKDRPFVYTGVDFAAGVMISSDGGRTWTLYGEIEVPNLLGAPNIKSWPVEPAVVETKDGRLVMFLRTNTGYLYKSVSYDRGRTWTEARRMVFSNPNSKEGALTLSNGQIALFWNNTQIVDYRTKRFPLMASLSEDGGETWPYTITLEDEQTVLGYPSVIEVKDGLRVVYDHHLKQARLVKLRAEDLRKRWTPINQGAAWQVADGVLRMTDEAELASHYEWTRWRKAIAFLARKPPQYTFEADFRFDSVAFNNDAAIGLFSGYQDEDNWLAWVWRPGSGQLGIEREEHFGLTRDPLHYRQARPSFYKNLRPQAHTWYRVQITQNHERVRWRLSERASGRVLIEDSCLITYDGNFIALGTRRLRASFDNIRLRQDVAPANQEQR